MKTDYCAYPPRMAHDVEVAGQRDGGRSAFVAGSLSVGRFILLRETEERVRRMLDGSLPGRAVCEEFQRRYGGTLSLATLTGFLAKLDEVGILDGERGHRPLPPDQQINTQFYVRCKLFNPDHLFTWMVKRMRWVWTSGFVTISAALMFAAMLVGVMNGEEVTRYTFYVVREHAIALLIAGQLIGLSHEFAHGLTCKAFGGRVPEVGLLQIYYVIPALYCNVSGIHLIPQRSRKLWVILAGIYWQVLVGAAALLAWFLLAPHTVAADLAFIVFLGGVVDVIFNANPLIKLDGYYFLSQWLRLPNLMNRSRAFWRGLVRRVLWGERDSRCVAEDRRERAIYFTYGLLSFVYTSGLRVVIVCFAGAYLMDRFQLFGLFATVGLALFYLRHALGRCVQWTSRSMISFRRRMEDIMATDKSAREAATPSRLWRRRVVPAVVLLLVLGILLLPWNASVGNYGTLVATPRQEVVIRAPEDGTLIQLQVRPGDSIVAGAVVGRMSSLDLDDQVIQAQAELAKTNTDYHRLLDELRASGESAARAERLLDERQSDFDDVDAEQRQIQQRREDVVARQSGSFLMAISLRVPENPSNRPTAPYPPAIAVLQAEVDSSRAQLEQADLRKERARKLSAEGLIARSELDAAETQASTLSIELSGASDRLEAALVEHRRKYNHSGADVDLTRADLHSARLRVEGLKNEIEATRSLIGTLEGRRDLLDRKRAQFDLIAPTGGTVFGEDLTRMAGRYLQKGTEILRVADSRQLLLRIQLPEREIGDIYVGCAVRLKTRSFPNEMFQGVVAKIGGESEPDQYGQPAYRVELAIENANGLLRPGMTGFARIDYGRQAIGNVLLHKVKQALRPELWMF